MWKTAYKYTHQSLINEYVFFSVSKIQAQIKENIEDPRHWPLCGEFTGDRWIPLTKDQ